MNTLSDCLSSMQTKMCMQAKCRACVRRCRSAFHGYVPSHGHNHWEQTDLRSQIFLFACPDNCLPKLALAHPPPTMASAGAGFDLVLTDLRMPDVSGFDLMHEVVHGEAFCDVPVVVMSGTDSQDAVLQVGAWVGGRSGRCQKVGRLVWR
jgi:CheY-like chemotaxis protein